jgi:endonuclease III
MTTDHAALVRNLLKHAGTTYAAEADVTLKDTPMPLFQLLTLCMLAAKPIGAEVAVAAAKELFHDGLRTPDAVLDSPRRTMIAAFGRAGYARYDESSATRLTDIATMVRDEYGGDLRALAERSQEDTAAATKLLQGFKGIGVTGAGIFLREVQDTWTWVRPYFDERALTTARELGLPSDAAELGALAPRRNAELAAALVRVSLDNHLRELVSPA